ncbi:MAG: ester cyclase [Thermoplasmata archaeon]
MSVEENERVIDRADEAFNAQEWDRYFELFAESVVWHSPSPEPLKGRAALREAFEGFVAAFPDTRIKKERSFGQGDWVCREYTFAGTHTGPLKGPDGETIPATNKPVRLQGCGVYKVEGGEITETRDYFDQLGFMAQLGLAP